MDERQYIQLNLANTVTITLMVMVGYAALALLVTLVQKVGPG